MKPIFNFVLLFVKDPLTSAPFYKKLFGWHTLEESPTFAMFALSSEVKLGLWSYKTAEPTVNGAPGASEIMFAYEDVDKIYAQWVTLGITIVQKPTQMDFGYTFVAVDPDGHRIRIARYRPLV